MDFDGEFLHLSAIYGLGVISWIGRSMSFDKRLSNEASVSPASCLTLVLVRTGNFSGRCVVIKRLESGDEVFDSFSFAL